MGNGREKTFIFSGTSGGGHVRLDKFLSAEKGLDLSRSRIQHLINRGAVRVNGEIRRPRYELKPGDRIVVSFPPQSVCAETPADINFELLHEDSSILVVNKPPGLVVHPSAGHPTGTLVHGLLSRYSDLSALGGPKRPGIVHRLDKDTSGVMVVAKDDRVHDFLAHQFKRREVRKRYLAVVHGKVQGERGVVDLPISRNPARRKEMSVSLLEGRRAVTEWDVVSIFPLGFSLLRITLRTGRTHQIRVHMAYQGYPVLGDTVYGHGKRWWKQQSSLRRETLTFVRRQMLHAELLGFIHPDSLKYVEFEAPPPPDMAGLIEWFTRNQGI